MNQPNILIVSIYKINEKNNKTHYKIIMDQMFLLEW